MNCCEHQCTQGRTCPARARDPLITANGGQSVDFTQEQVWSVLARWAAYLVTALLAIAAAATALYFH